MTALAEQVKRGEHELEQTRRELSAVTRQAGSYLEVLRTREWRRGFDQNRFLDWDAKMSAARAGHGVLLAERDRLKQTAAALSGKLIEQEEEIGKLRAASAADAEALASGAQDLKQSAHARGELRGASRRSRRNAGACAARSRGATRRSRSRVPERPGSPAVRGTESANRNARGGAGGADGAFEGGAPPARVDTRGSQARERRTGAQGIQRRPAERGEPRPGAALSDPRRPAGARILDSAPGAQREQQRQRAGAHSDQHREARRCAGAGAERGPSLNTDWLAQLVRIDAGHEATYPLGRRTRLGRAPECELHVDSQSVSRHHALIVKGLRDLIIEDLNSTNGVIVNGRKVSRLFLRDGDTVTIGDIQFRCVLNPAVPASQAQPGPSPAAPPSA